MKNEQDLCNHKRQSEYLLISAKIILNEFYD